MECYCVSRSTKHALLLPWPTSLAVAGSMCICYLAYGAGPCAACAVCETAWQRHKWPLQGLLGPEHSVDLMTSV